MHRVFSKMFLASKALDGNQKLKSNFESCISFILPDGKKGISFHNGIEQVSIILITDNIYKVSFETKDNGSYFRTIDSDELEKLFVKEYIKLNLHLFPRKSPLKDLLYPFNREPVKENIYNKFSSLAVRTI